MSALRSIILAVAALLMLAAPAWAAPPTGDSVSGSGYRLLDGAKVVQFRIDARATSDGAMGSYSFRSLVSDLTLSGPVTCVDVAGNQAAIGGTITRSNLPAALGKGFLVFLVDNGDPYRGQAGPDIVSQTYIYPDDSGIVDFGGGFPDTCPDADETAHDAFDISGNVVVKDAT